MRGHEREDGVLYRSSVNGLKQFKVRQKGEVSEQIGQSG